MEVVESAKYYAENPRSNKSDFLLDGADAVCNAETPTSMAEFLGIDTSNSMSPRQWFQNTCGPIIYAAENEFEMKTQDITRAVSSAGATLVGSPASDEECQSPNPMNDSIESQDDDQDQGVETSRISF
jgi:hypothetical protein